MKIKLKNILIMSVSLFFSLNSWSGYEVGNGGGLAEKNVFLALKKLPEILSFCMESDACHLTAKETQILKAIQIHYRDNQWAVPSDRLKIVNDKSFLDLLKGEDLKQIWIAQSGSPENLFIHAGRIINYQSSGKPITFEKAIRELLNAFGKLSHRTELLVLEGIGFKLEQFVLKKTNETNQDLNSDSENPLSAEAQLIMFAENLADFFELTFQNSEVFEKSDFELIQEIRRILKLEPAVNQLLRFESAKVNPKRFIIDGVIKSAVTGSSPGALIYFNTDDLYLINGSQKEAISEGALLALLIHELGHHTGELSHSKLDLFSVNVSEFLLNSMTSIQFQEDRDMAYFHKPAFFQLKILDTFSKDSGSQKTSKILMGDEVSYFNFNPYFESMLKCHAGELPKSYRVNFAFWNGKFSDSGEYRWVEYKDHGVVKKVHIQLQNFELPMDISMECESKNGEPYSFSQTLRIDLTYSTQFELDPNAHLPKGRYVFDRATVY